MNDRAAPPSPSEGRDTTDTVDHSDPNLNTTAPNPITSLPFSSSSTSSPPHPLAPSSLPSSSPPPSSPSFSRYFCIPSTVSFILAHNARHIALQFPDSLLPLSPHISHLLTSLLPSPPPSLYILADTSYAPCCVDVTAAQHCNADAIIHYGLACLSTTHPLPVHFVFGQAELDVQALYDRIAQLGWEDSAEGEPDRGEGGERGLLVFCDVEFEWKMEELKAIVSRGRDEGRTSRPIVIASVQPQSHLITAATASEEARVDDPATALHTIAGHAFRLPSSTPLSSFSLLFIGSPESPMLTNLLLAYNSLPAYLYNPSSPSPPPSPSIIPSTASTTIRRTLARRYYLTQHCLSASIIGVVVATLSHTSALPTLTRLQQLIRAAGKRSYTVVVGKINPSKLANFGDVDLWVMISCPYSAILADGGGRGGYFREVVTPMELEMGLKGTPWTGRYETDMRKLGIEEEGEEGAAGSGESSGEREEGEGEVMFDSATGKLREVLPSFSRGGTALIARESGEMVRTAADAMRERSWRGLETEHERRLRMQKEAAEDAELTGSAEAECDVAARIQISLVEPGLDGIASRYTKERAAGGSHVPST